MSDADRRCPWREFSGDLCQAGVATPPPRGQPCVALAQEHSASLGRAGRAGPLCAGVRGLVGGADRRGDGGTVSGKCQVERGPGG